MKKIYRALLSASILLLFSGAASASIVRPGPPGVVSSEPVVADSSGSGDSSTADNSTTGAETQTEVETHGKDLAEQFHVQAKAALEAAKSHHTAAQKQQACEARQASLSKRMSNAVSTATRIKGVIDDKYTKVQDFYTSKNLNVTDYQSLKAAVDTAQGKAADSISALQATDTTIDCASGTAAETVSAFRAAVSNTRDSLKAYRDVLVNLITKIHGASTANSQSSGQSIDNSSTQQTNTTNTNQ